MRNLFKLVLLVICSSTFFGCAHNYYNVPQETLEKRVKVVGVTPFFTDADSDLRYPDKEALVSLTRSYNAKNEKELTARLRDAAIFYSIRPLDGDPVTLFGRLVANRERRDDAGIIYNKYFFKKDELRQIMNENQLDALLVVTVSGITMQSKIYASNYLAYLETDFNYLTMTAQLLDRDGAILWEYPNFRRSALSYAPLLGLQYPDFDEAKANLSEKVDVKNKTLTGINAAFAQSESSAVAKGHDVSSLYARQFDDMMSLLKLKKPLFGGKDDAAPATPATPAASQPAPAVTPAPAPARPAPVSEIKPVRPVSPPPEAPAPAPAVNVPAPAPTDSNAIQVAPGDVVPEQPAK
ncbi:hypothetical protein [Geomonas sp. Red32]|uniref:hypothetical protein n=1 Tax=Geomonas sp. Red32 TaxID=2912856 RepID=UPI002545C9F0|nr:hypothetical protein [Geomonas sp. Red32]